MNLRAVSGTTRGRSDWRKTPDQKGHQISFAIATVRLDADMWHLVMACSRLRWRDPASPVDPALAYVRGMKSLKSPISKSDKTKSLDPETYL